MIKTSGSIIRTLFCVYFLLSCSTICVGGECIKSRFVVAIDVGHTRKNGGATSATGVPEYVFNKKLADALLQELKKDGYTKSFFTGDNSLKDRIAIANQRKANLLLSIHHDSVQPQYLSKWIHGDRTHMYCDKYKGFSVFYSQKNGAADQSLVFASLLGAEMLKKGFAPSLHHAERVKGESRQLVDEKRGIYRYDDLFLLKGVAMPAILLECGIIVNRREEELLNSPAYRMGIVVAIQHAITTYCTTQK